MLTFTPIDSAWGPKCIPVPIQIQWGYIYSNQIIVLGMRQKQKNIIEYYNVPMA